MDKKIKENIKRRDVATLIVPALDGTFKLGNIYGLGPEAQGQKIAVLVKGAMPEVFIGYLELLPSKKFALWDKPKGSNNNISAVHRLEKVAAWDTFENAVKDWDKRYI